MSSSQDPNETPDRAERARSFARVAGEYERGRPGYPRAAIQWLLGAKPLEVLDLGAGTGKLSAALLEAGHRVTAVEPLDEMRAILTSRLPQAHALDGTAEQLPLADASVDAVVVGAAFHWFDQSVALAEIARVLRPPGVLGLLGNAFDTPAATSRSCPRASGSRCWGSSICCGKKTRSWRVARGCCCRGGRGCDAATRCADAHPPARQPAANAKPARMIDLSMAFLPSPSSNGVYLGPLFVHYYGLAYVLAVIAAVRITMRRWEAKGGERELVYDVALWGFPAGVIGGRLYFIATSWSEVPSHWWGPFAVWDGGLGIWGGIALGALVGIWRLRRAGVDVAQFLDAAAPALLVAQAIGRVGNYFNQELFGGPSTLPWALEISPAHRPVGYSQDAAFEPTFLYELIWNLLLAGALVWLGNHRKIRPPGLFALYVAGYSLARIGEELLRVDPAHHIFGLRLNFYVATILCLTGIAWFVRIQRASPP